jgi:hypothetical protein
VREFAGARIDVLPAVPRRSRSELLVVGTRAKPAQRSAAVDERANLLCHANCVELSSLIYCLCA